MLFLVKLRAGMPLGSADSDQVAFPALPTVVSRRQLIQILNIFHCFVIVFNIAISVSNLEK